MLVNLSVPIIQPNIMSVTPVVLVNLVKPLNVSKLFVILAQPEF